MSEYILSGLSKGDSGALTVNVTPIARSDIKQTLLVAFANSRDSQVAGGLLAALLICYLMATARRLKAYA